MPSGYRHSVVVGRPYKGDRTVWSEASVLLMDRTCDQGPSLPATVAPVPWGVRGAPLGTGGKRGAATGYKRDRMVRRGVGTPPRGNH